MYLKDLVLGIDFGNVIVHTNNEGNKAVFPRAMEVIAKCCQKCKGVYIVSKANERNRLKILNWLSKSGFYQTTGLPTENVFFCGARYQKGIIASKLKINCFIDDRPEVMAHLDKSIYKILFRPLLTEIQQFNQGHLLVVYDWDDIESVLLRENT